MWTLSACVSQRLRREMEPSCVLHVPSASLSPLQPTEPIKRQPRSQCLSTLVRPVFGEVRVGLSLWSCGVEALFFRGAPCRAMEWYSCGP